MRHIYLQEDKPHTQINEILRKTKRIQKNGGKMEMKIFGPQITYILDDIHYSTIRERYI